MKALSRRRASRGSSISEFAPALMFLLFALFFPLLDMVALGLTYNAGFTLTDLQAEKAAVVSSTDAKSDTGPVKGKVVNAWMQTGIGSFTKLAAPPITDIAYPLIDGIQYVSVTTTISANPFLTIPFIPGIPGMSAPVNLTFSSRRVLEDPRHLAEEEN